MMTVMMTIIDDNDEYCTDDDECDGNNDGSGDYNISTIIMRNINNDG